MYEIGQTSDANYKGILYVSYTLLKAPPKLRHKLYNIAHMIQIPTINIRNQNIPQTKLSDPPSSKANKSNFKVRSPLNKKEQTYIKKLNSFYN